MRHPRDAEGFRISNSWHVERATLPLSARPALAPTPGLAAGLAAGLVLARRWRRHLAAGLVLARGWRRHLAAGLAVGLAIALRWRHLAAGLAPTRRWRPHLAVGLAFAR
jgi:hypothetical protein